LLSLLLLLAVVPTVELAEQLAHVIDHAVEGDAPDHAAHHDGTEGDEHGCTGLIHLCSCHHASVTAAAPAPAMSAVELLRAVVARPPPSLVDLNSLEPPNRPPIA
jgi:hypothetical protein